MALIQSKFARGQIAIPYPAFAGVVCAFRFFHDLAAAPAVNDIIELAQLPVDTRPIDLILDCDDLDTGTAIALDVGVMSGEWGSTAAGRTIGAEFFAASTLAQAGGVARPTIKQAFRVEPASYDRSIGIKIATAAAAFQAGQIGLTLLYSTR